jgi:N-acetylglucosamine-6-phosphate deacetylase
VEAVEAATLHPAQLLGIEKIKGTLSPGADADILFLNDDLDIQRVFVAGEEVDLGK